MRPEFNLTEKYSSYFGSLFSNIPLKASYKIKMRIKAKIDMKSIHEAIDSS